MHSSKKAALARILVIAIAMVNSGLAHYGFNPIPVSEEFLYTLLSDLALLGVFGYLGIYKDNPVTDEGAQGTAVTRKLKNKKLSEDEIQSLQKAKHNINTNAMK